MKMSLPAAPASSPQRKANDNSLHCCHCFRTVQQRRRCSAI